MKIVIASDHAGFSLKESLKDYLRTELDTVDDFGPYSESPVDFPDYAFRVANTVARGEAALGIMIDGVGSSSAIVCNKVPGIRACVLYNEFSAQIAREHSHANVLCLGSKLFTPETATKALDAFFAAEELGGKYLKRLQKIDTIEDQFARKSSTPPSKRRLVTEKELRDARRMNIPLVLSKTGSFLTPAAQDYLEKNPGLVVWEL